MVCYGYIVAVIFWLSVLLQYGWHYLRLLSVMKSSSGIGVRLNMNNTRLDAMVQLRYGGIEAVCIIFLYFKDKILLILCTAALGLIACMVAVQ
jgi:hypothetical protein